MAQRAEGTLQLPTKLQSDLSQCQHCALAASNGQPPASCQPIGRTCRAICSTPHASGRSRCSQRRCECGQLLQYDGGADAILNLDNINLLSHEAPVQVPSVVLDAWASSEGDRRKNFCKFWLPHHFDTSFGHTACFHAAMGTLMHASWSATCLLCGTIMSSSLLPLPLLVRDGPLAAPIFNVLGLLCESMLSRPGFKADLDLFRFFTTDPSVWLFAKVLKILNHTLARHN